MGRFSVVKVLILVLAISLLSAVAGTIALVVDFNSYKPPPKVPTKTTSK